VRPAHRFIGSTCLAAACAVLMWTCGSGSGSSSSPATPAPTTPTSPGVSSVVVTGAAPVVGAEAQFTATAALSDGMTQNVTAQASWLSSNPAVATVSASGVVTGVGPGQAEVGATYQNITGSITVGISGASPPAPLSCGTERWSVKTLSDADAPRVNLNEITSTSISALNGFAAHCSRLPDARTFPEEFRVYEVSGVAQLTRNEDDHDVHIALSDPNDASQTIVVEVADPACAGAAQSPDAPVLAHARSQYQNIGALTGKTVKVRGVGFYDFDHGQTGRSRNCIELHPVIDISLAPAPAPAPTPTRSPTPGHIPTPSPGTNICNVTSAIATVCGTATAVCNDHPSTCAQNRTGTCAGHAGVSCWICPGPLCTP